MPARWERDLRRMREMPVPLDVIRQRASEPPRGGPALPPTRDRVAAAAVALAVFVAVSFFGWRTLGRIGDDAAVPVGVQWPVATITLGVEGGVRTATLSIDGRTQEGMFGASTSPDERYPYRWENPQIAEPIEIPLGAELRLAGDVEVKEILFGDADRLDAGERPDSGPMSSDQPDFDETYFPVHESTDREYWKVFGTWADGSVLDVYFEVRWVAPEVDLSDGSVDIVLTPATLRADLLYGGQRLGTGGSGGYGDMAVTAGGAGGWDPETVYFPIAAGSSIEVLSDDLRDWTVRFPGEPAGRVVPDVPGRATMSLDVTWGDGAATFRFPIETVQVPSAEPPQGPPSVGEAAGRISVSADLRSAPGVRCTASIGASVVPGQQLSLAYALENVGEDRAEVGVMPPSYPMSVTDGDGVTWDTTEVMAHSWPFMEPVVLRPGETHRMSGTPLGVQFPGPLEVVPTCAGERLDPIRVDVVVTGEPVPHDDALARVVGASGGLLDGCVPPPNGDAIGTLASPDGSEVLDVRCAADVVDVPGFAVVTLVLTSPPSLEPPAISPGVLSLADLTEMRGSDIDDSNAETIVWRFVVTPDDVIAVASATHSRSTPADAMTTSYVVSATGWRADGGGRCGGDSFAAGGDGSHVQVEFFGSCR